MTWKKIKLAKLLTSPIQNGYSPICPELPNGKWILGLGALNGSGFDSSQIKPAPINDSKVDDFLLQPGDFLVSRSNTLDKVGRAALFTGQVDNCAYPDLMMRFRIDESRLHQGFLEMFLRSSEAVRYFQRTASGTSETMVKINKGVLEKLLVPLPLYKEQVAIAELLAIWSRAIEKTKRLIAAKEKRFAWLLNKLVNERKTSDNWQKVFLGEVADIRTGNKDNQNKVEAGKYPFFVRSQNIERIDTFSFDGEAILIPGEGKIGEIIHYINGKFDYHQRVYKISNFSGSISGEFLFYYLKCFFPRQAVMYTVKATADSLRLPSFTRMVIAFPNLSQQKMSAETLNIAQKEIDLIKEQLEAYRKQKRGLMQKLLTGQWRVKIKEEHIGNG